MSRRSDCVDWWRGRGTSASTCRAFPGRSRCTTPCATPRRLSLRMDSRARLRMVARPADPLDDLTVQVALVGPGPIQGSGVAALEQRARLLRLQRHPRRSALTILSTLGRSFFPVRSIQWRFFSPWLDGRGGRLRHAISRKLFNGDQPRSPYIGRRCVANSVPRNSGARLRAVRTSPASASRSRVRRRRAPRLPVRRHFQYTAVPSLYVRSSERAADPLLSPDALGA